MTGVGGSVFGDPNGGVVSVLAVDDDVDFADLTAAYLERDARFAVSTANSADEAMACLETDALPDCIISDHDMPGTNGLEFLAAVRDHHPELPFILYTGKGSEEIASDAITAGVTDYVKKGGPEQYDVLANRVQNAVECRASQQALREEKELLEQVLATTPGSIVCTRDGEIEYATARAARTLGVDRSCLLRARWDGPDTWTYTNYDGEPLAHEDRPVTRVFEAGERVANARVAVTEPGGERRYLTVDAAPLDPGAGAGHGDVKRAVVSFRDVTVQVLHELELERSRTVLDALGDATYVLDPDGNFTYANDALAALSGYSIDELVGAHCSLVLPDEHVERGTDLIRDLLRAERDRGIIEMALDRRDGSRVAVENHVALLPSEDGRFRGTAGIARDVTDRVEQERRLRENEQKYATVVEEANDGIVIARDGIVQFTNPKTHDVLKRDSGELVGTPVAELVVPEDREKIMTRLRERLSDQHPERRYELTALAGDGSHVPIELTASVITYEGEPAVLAICRDVSERKRRERELEQYETIVQTAPDGVFIVDEHANYAGGNESGVALTGYTRAELADKSVPDLVEAGVFGEEVIPRYVETVRRLLSADNDDEKGAFEFTITTDGESRTFECHVSLRPFDPEAGETFRGSIGVLRDVTERNRREHELERQNERLAEFANVVSHDLRNPLNVAAGNLDIARTTGEEDAYDRIKDAHDRMAEILADILTLARTGQAVGDTEPVSLHGVARSAWATVDTGDATLSLRDDLRFDADPGRLRQLFENLYANASQHAGPAVTVTVAALSDGDGFSVTDDGPGIPQDVRDEVFDSGVTTREDGTGFGLAIVQTIADAHGWSVSLGDAEGDGGARIELRF